MIRLSRCVTLCAGIGLAVAAGTGRASLYSPDDPMAVPVAADGTPQPFAFDPEFKRRLAVLKNLLNPEMKDNKDREKVLERIAVRQKVRPRPPAESAALAADLLRVGKAGEAAGVLAAGERRGYLPNMTLAHIHAMEGDWATATEYLEIANGERPPAELPGLTPAQIAWQTKVNRGPLAELFKSRWQESRRRPDPDTETPDPIFPVRFVNAAGKYEPGVLAPEERAKLPADAVATVQQLLLWFPTDVRLYWLLGELYAATGQFAWAEQVFDFCVSTAGKYGNRKVLQSHRTAVLAAAAAQPKPPPPPEDAPLAADGPKAAPLDAGPISLRTIGIYFGAVAAIAVLAFIRTMAKKGRGGACGPVG